MLSDTKKRALLRFISVEILFIILTMFMVLIFIKYKSLFYTSDDIFNIQRVKSIWESLFKGEWPQFMDSQVLPYGVATPTIYPYGLLILLSPLYLLQNNFYEMLTIIIIGYLLSLNISYFAYKCSPLSRNTGHVFVSSLFFSILYTFSIENLGQIRSLDVAELYANALVPLVIFGWMNWYKKDKWHQLAIGFILLMLCHIVTSFVIAILLTVLTIYFFNSQLLKKRFKSLLFAIVIIMLCTSVIWIPICVLIFRNHMYLAQFMVKIMHQQSIQLSNLIHKSSYLDSFGMLIFPASIKAYDPLQIWCIILIVLLWKHLPHRDHVALIVVIIIQCVQSIAHNIILNNSFDSSLFTESILQLSGRYLIEIQLFLVCIFIYALIKIIPRYYDFNYHITLLVLTTLILFNVYSLNNAFIKSSIYITKPKAIKLLRNINRNKRLYMPYGYMLSVSKQIIFRISESAFNSRQLSHYQLHFDYFPKSYRHTYFDVNNVIAHNKVVPHQLESNGKIKFKADRDESSINVPIATYHAQRTIIKLDGHPIRWNHSKSGMVQIHNVHKGTHTVQLVTPIMWYRWISFVTTLLGFGLLPYDIHKHHK